ncbi:MAG: Gfo/Idh/MocA family oxidoreductase [Hyphomicrobiales bacterium]|nr:Gfo/Idh/MocA family oxidoreductase [Hyphomicrobiales bacterium]
MAAHKIGIIGLGKITMDQHVPVIAANPAFELVAVSSQRGIEVDGAKTFRSPAEMYTAVPDLDAVAVCTPPQVRHGFAREALAAGKHVLLEKPPAATISELDDLAAFAAERNRVLFTTWHSQYNAAVTHTRELLAGQRVRRMAITWKEDVRHWHPGQKWIWAAGGFGVFDPGINALSIATEIFPDPLLVREADLTFPSNCDAPIAASLTFATHQSDQQLTAEFDWRQTGSQTWDIALEKADGTELTLSKGGSRLEVNGVLDVERKSAEYTDIYDRFAQLLRDNRSLVDDAPLRLVADVFLIGRRLVTDPFHD